MAQTFCAVVVYASCFLVACLVHTERGTGDPGKMRYGRVAVSWA